MKVGGTTAKQFVKGMNKVAKAMRAKKKEDRVSLSKVLKAIESERQSLLGEIEDLDLFKEELEGTGKKSFTRKTIEQAREDSGYSAKVSETLDAYFYMLMHPKAKARRDRMWEGKGA